MIDAQYLAVSEVKMKPLQPQIQNQSELFRCRFANQLNMNYEINLKWFLRGTAIATHTNTF